MAKKRVNVVSVKKMRELDRKAIEEFEIPSLILMENAGRSAADAALRMLRNQRKGNRAAIISGKGNNGGDGLAAARHLINSGILVTVFIIAESAKSLRGDSETNFRILQHMKADVQFLTGKAGDMGVLAAALRGSQLIVDALFGTGLSKNLKEPYFSVVQCINKSGRPVLSIDIPSGLNADSGKVMGIAVNAYRTITLACFKTGLLKGKGPRQAGTVEVGSISMPTQLIV